MNNFKKNINKVIIVISLVFIGVFIYNYVKNPKEDDITEQASGGIGKNSAEVIRILGLLSKIEINSKFFDNNFEEESNLIPFNKLVDSSKDKLLPRNKSKKNPFVSDRRVIIREDTATTDIIKNEEEVLTQ